ncbi:MAG: hypothetical protein HZA04_07305 [Nitrospinae bacterium]|nr:hypothetical protein [Nitrospinota bacterium]
MQTENGAFWEGLEKRIERSALGAGPLNGGFRAFLRHLVIAPATEFLFLLLNNLFRGADGPRTAVQGAVFVFAVNARRYEHGNRDQTPMERISAELNGGNGVAR